MFRVLFLGLLCALPLAAAAQSEQSKDVQFSAAQSRDDPALTPELLRSGWRARQLIGQTVRAEGNQQIGTVRDIIVDRNGHAAAVIVEGGGVAGIPEAVFRIPWQNVTVTRPDGAQPKLQVSSDWKRSERSAESQSGAPTWPYEYRVSEVIGDSARLRPGYLFGYVTDVVFSPVGRVAAVLVHDTSAGRDRRAAQGVLAFSFHGRTTGPWDPGSSYFGLPAATPQQARQLGLEIDRESLAGIGRRGEEGGRAGEASKPIRDDTAQKPGDRSVVSKGLEGHREMPSETDRKGARAAAGTGDGAWKLISREARVARLPSLESLYQGWRAKSLIDQTVYGTNNNELGEVHDIILNADGRISAIVVEGGGFLEIGDAHFRIPWAEVDRTPGRDGIMVGLSAQDATEKGLFDSGEAVATGEREFRLSELLNDYVVLANGVGFGYVEDAVFNDKGQILAILANRDIRYGPRYAAYPFYGYAHGWHPAYNYYAIPFVTVDDASRGPSIDVKRFAQMDRDGEKPPKESN